MRKNETIVIKVDNPIECSIPRPFAARISKLFEYDASAWREGQHRKVQMKYKKYAWSGRDKNRFHFYSGMLPIVTRFLSSKNFSYRVDSEDWTVVPKLPGLPGITFRSDQKFMINQAIDHQRGLILSPTGSGKTIIQMGIMSAFKKENIIVLAHTREIVRQTYEEIRKFFPGVRTQMIDGETGKSLHGQFVVSTMQSFAKIPVKDRIDYFTVLIVDEAHHISTLNGTYAKILRTQLAPVRLGFTATRPVKQEAILATTGFLGPVVGKLSIDAAAKLGIIAKPKIKIVKVKSDKVWGNFKEVYTSGIVENRIRNLKIKEIAADYIEEGKTVLIMVTRIDHGERLHKMTGLPFVEGQTASSDRKYIKDQLSEKQIPGAICTNVWAEGINIPSLDVVINACGGKSEIRTLQSIGRGLRKTDKKDQVTIVDFFDPISNYLVSHFGERISLYTENSWI